MTHPLLRTLPRTSVYVEMLRRRLLRTLLRSTSFKEPPQNLLRSTSFKEPFKNPSKKRAVAWPPWCAPKLKGDENSECKLSNGWSPSYKVIKLFLSARKWAVAKFQGEKSASQSSMELYFPSEALCVSWKSQTGKSLVIWDRGALHVKIKGVIFSTTLIDKVRSPVPYPPFQPPNLFPPRTMPPSLPTLPSPQTEHANGRQYAKTGCRFDVDRR